MSNFNDNLETFDTIDNKLPTGLNVLTILTIVWSVISILLSIYSFAKAKTNYDEKDTPSFFLSSFYAAVDSIHDLSLSLSLCLGLGLGLKKQCGI